MIRGVAGFAVPRWVTVVSIAAVIAGYTGWVMWKQHAHDQIKYDALEERYNRFVEQVGEIGKIARETNARVERENAEKLAKMENDHAMRESRIKDQAALADKLNAHLLASLRLQLAGEGGGPGSGPRAGAPDATDGTPSGGLECYDAAELEQRVRGSLGRFLTRVAGIVRRGEEAESLVDLCRAFASGFKPPAPETTLK